MMRLGRGAILLLAFSLFASAATLTGCVTPSTLLIHPDQGQVVRCAAQGWGYVGAPMAQQIEASCVKDYKKLGYVELPDVVLGFFFEPGNSRIKLVATGFPAEEVGIQVGDVVTQIDGRPIRNNRDLFDVMTQRKAGDVLVINVTRGAETLEFRPTVRNR